MTTITIDNPSALDHAVDQGAKHLGWSCSWSLSGYHPADRVNSIFADHFGVDKKGRALFAPHPVTPETALKRALVSMKTETQTDFVKKIKRGHLGAVGADVDMEEDDLVPSRRFTAKAYREPDGAVTVECSEPALAERVEWGVRYFLRTITPDDLSPALTNLITEGAHGVSQRDRGGVYFVPASEEAMVHKVRAVLDDLGSGCKLYALGVLDLAGYRADTFALAHQSLLRELRALQDEIKEDLRPNIDTVRLSTLQKRVLRYQELRQRAEVYEDLLSMSMEDVTGGLDALKSAMRTLIALKG